MASCPPDWKRCATCVKWGGSRRPADYFINRVEYDMNARGKCYGGGWNMHDMSAEQSCNQWEPQYKKR